MATGKQQSITITASNKMSDEEIDKKVKEAEKFAEEDKKAKENIEIKNNADQMVYQTEKSLKDLAEQLSDDDKKLLEEKKEALKKAAEGNDYEDMKAKTEELTNEFYRISQKVYQEAAAKNPQGGNNSENDDKDDTIDGDYEVVD